MGVRVHELGIVFYIIDDAKKAATDNGLTSRMPGRGRAGASR